MSTFLVQPVNKYSVISFPRSAPSQQASAAFLVVSSDIFDGW
jgi:hypothetical protein